VPTTSAGLCRRVAHVGFPQCRAHCLGGPIHGGVMQNYDAACLNGNIAEALATEDNATGLHMPALKPRKVPM